MKTRVIRIDGDSRYLPQFKPGWLSRWRFFKKDVDKYFLLRVVDIETFNPAEAAGFLTYEDARSMIQKLLDKAKENDEAYAIRYSKTHNYNIKVKEIING